MDIRPADSPAAASPSSGSATSSPLTLAAVGFLLGMGVGAERMVSHGSSHATTAAAVAAPAAPPLEAATLAQTPGGQYGSPQAVEPAVPAWKSPAPSVSYVGAAGAGSSSGSAGKASAGHASSGPTGSSAMGQLVAVKTLSASAGGMSGTEAASAGATGAFSPTTTGGSVSPATTSPTQGGVLSSSATATTSATDSSSTGTLGTTTIADPSGATTTVGVGNSSNATSYQPLVDQANSDINSARKYKYAGLAMIAAGALMAAGGLVMLAMGIKAMIAARALPPTTGVPPVPNPAKPPAIAAATKLIVLGAALLGMGIALIIGGVYMKKTADAKLADARNLADQIKNDYGQNDQAQIIQDAANKV
jgi:hypothetical protein